jgi:hypothetical protein
VDVSGRVALVLRHGPQDDDAVYYSCPPSAACVGEPCNWNFGYKVANAALHGAAAVLVVQDYRHPATELVPGDLGVEYYSAGVAAAFVDRTPFDAALPDLEGWAATLDASLLPQSRPTGLEVSVTISAQITTLESANVIGSVPGTDATLAEEAIVVGGHVDHLGVDPLTGEIYLGADDNASGTAVMMELARAIAHPGFQPKRTVLFAAWNAEEAGLFGSCHYVQNAPVLPLDRTVAMLSVDMVGAGDGSGIDLYGGNLAEHDWLVRTLQGSASLFALPWAVTPLDPLDASDHVCFAQAGIPALLVTTSGDPALYHTAYHTPGDSIATISLGDLEAAASLLRVGLEALALGLEAQYQAKAGPRPGVGSPRPPGHHRWLRTR